MNKNKETNEVTYWQKYSGIYDFTRRSDMKAYLKMYRMIGDRLDKNMNVLELATGTGLISLAVADKVRHIDATDFSPAMIEQANRKVKPDNVDFSVQDACNLPYEDNSYDAVIISNALHIMPEPERAIAEIKRVLKHDGVLIAPTYTPTKSLKERIVMRFMVDVTKFPAYSKWTSDEYCSFLIDHGFAIKNKVLLNAAFTITYVECCL